jgi:tmRNA-binding protein
LLAAVLYQGNPYRNHQLWNINYHIYPIELEVKDTTDTDRSASYLAQQLEIDREGRLRMKPYVICPVVLFHQITKPRII